MKKSLACMALLGLLSLSSASHAALLLRGGGTMFYDTQSNLTWLADASAGGARSYGDAKAWAEGLVQGGFDDWRLPGVSPVNGLALQLDYSEDGSTDVGLNGSGLNAELGHLFYGSLGNAAWSLANTGPFSGLLDADDPIGPAFWTGTESQAGWSLAFFMGIGDQEELAQDTLARAWAVRVGDVEASVPEPATLPLVLAALLGVIGLSRRSRQA